MKRHFLSSAVSASLLIKSTMKAVKRDTTADLRHFDSGTSQFWSPELRRAMMKVHPEYFSWPLERRERYGVRRLLSRDVI